MLGSTGEADDAVQEAWLRLSRSDSEAVDNLRAWLTTVVGRVSLDLLRARKARREAPDGASARPLRRARRARRGAPDGPDNIEPIVTDITEDTPAEEAELAGSIGIAM